MVKIPDEEIARQLQYGESDEVNQALTYLHKRVYRQVVKFMVKYYGTTNDTDDVFQDGLLAIYKLARKGALNKGTNMEAYLFTICKNLWFQQLRKKKDIIDLEKIPDEIASPEIVLFRLMKQEEQVEIKRILSQMGDSCRKVLTFFYYKKIRMKEIAERMAYSSEQVAKNRKSECIKKLRKLMANSPLFKNRLS